MKKDSLKNKKISSRAFTLLELILAVAIFSGSAIATGYLIIEAMNTTDANSKKIQATFLAREGLEAVRMIRDREGFSSGLSNDDYGVEFDEVSEEWEFVDSPDISDEIYERTITIENWSDDPTNVKLITSFVRVPAVTRDVTVTLQTLLSNWPES